jgi:polysaccharide export outer membrane protein
MIIWEKLVLVGVVFLCLVCFPKMADAEEGILEPGDVLNVDVYGYPELSLSEVVIQSNGKMAVPLAGEVEASGQSTNETAKTIARQLDTYLENPIVTINLVRRKMIKISVLGEVNHPGYYSFERGRTVLESISMASGWTQSAAKTKVFLIHKAQLSQPPQKINLLDILNKNDISQNHELVDGDIIYLSSNHRIDIVRDILPFVYPGYLLHHWEKVP